MTQCLNLPSRGNVQLEGKQVQNAKLSMLPPCSVVHCHCNSVVLELFDKGLQVDRRGQCVQDGALRRGTIQHLDITDGLWNSTRANFKS